MMPPLFSTTRPAPPACPEQATVRLDGAIPIDREFKTRYSNERLGYENGGDAVWIPPAAARLCRTWGSDKWSGGIYFTGRAAGAGLESTTMTGWAATRPRTSNCWLPRSHRPSPTNSPTNCRRSALASTGMPTSTSSSKVPGWTRTAGADRLHQWRRHRLRLYLGAMYELTDRTRFGISYQSEIKPGFRRGPEIKGAGPRRSVASSTN